MRIPSTVSLILTTVAFTVQAQYWTYEFDGKFSGNSVETFQVGEAKFGEKIQGELTPVGSRVETLQGTFHMLSSICLNEKPGTFAAWQEMRRVNAIQPSLKSSELWPTAPILLKAKTNNSGASDSRAMAVNNTVVSISFYKEYVNTRQDEILASMEKKYGKPIIHETEVVINDTNHYLAYGEHSVPSLKTIFTGFNNTPFRYQPGIKTTGDQFSDFWDRIKDHPDLPETPLLYANISISKETGRVALYILGFSDLKAQVNHFNKMVDYCAEKRRQAFQKATDKKLEMVRNEL
ncbi:hypothetical protein [Vibrio owensii]|uniref:hypothetical protein n=1 Tax=Vibrio owensii TaxID=696485 RepID=UPI000596B4F4|nr:hypothetical protein [Vibrio owensii]